MITILLFLMGEQQNIKLSADVETPWSVWINWLGEKAKI